MGTRGREILKVDVEMLLEKLNAAYASEWLAYYQYWLGAKVIKGPMKEEVAAELLVHATEELNHADMVANRIITLGGTPVLEPRGWYDKSPCEYESPQDAYIGTLIDQNIRGEQCAITTYQELMDFTEGNKDPVTYNIAMQILQDEIEHEEDLEGFKEDLELLTRGNQ